MLKFLFSLLVFYTGLGLSINYSQQFINVSFDQLPANYQLFGREKDNSANIPISGTVQAAGYAYVSIVKLRNDVRIGYQRINLKYSNATNAAFSATSKIQSELAEYTFDIYLCKSATDSSLAVHRNNIVAGDFYIIYGQSNAVAWEVDYQYRNEYCRSYGFQGWALSNSTSPRVGLFGIEFQRVIAEKQKIPTCVINGAVAGASITHLISRNPNDHADQNTVYGQLLTSARRTGLLPYLRGMFYWQGETEAASGDPASWGPQFDQLVGLWKEDFPTTEKIYVFQLPLFGGGAYDDKIGVLREQQRTLDKKYAIVQPYAALGAPGWDGFHYKLDGYLQLGRELADMAAYNHYGAKQKISSPSLQKAFYSTPQRDEITMVFEDYQAMVYPKDSVYENIEGSLEKFTNYKVKDFFYLNAVWQKLESGKAEENKIVVKLKEVQNDTLIKYLPSKFHFSGALSAPWVYIGPFLSNTQGFRAFAFHHNKIYPYKNLGTLALTASETDFVVLNWNKLAEVSGYTLERYEEGKFLETQQIFHLPASQTEFVDSSAVKGTAYTYRIRGFTAQNESKTTSVTYTKISADIIAESSLLVFPNPVAEKITITSARNKIGHIDMYTIDGKKFKTINANGLETLEISVRDMSTGQYILKIFSENDIATRKILVVR